MKKLIIAIMINYSFLIFHTNAQTVLLSENFSNGLPSGWYVDSAGYTPVVNGWHYNANGLNITGAGFDRKYMEIFVYHTWPNNSYLDEYNLVTDSFNASSLSSVFLSYGEMGGGSSSGNLNNVDVSTDSGITWQTAFMNGTNSHGNNLVGYRNVIDISHLAAGQSNVRVRFHLGQYVQWTSGGMWLDSVVVADSIPCTIPADSMGVTVNNRSYCCTGSIAYLRNDGLSGGIGQTYQWYYGNGGSANTLIPGAIYDTTSFLQNGPTYYQCQVTCSGSTSLTKELLLGDTPNDTARAWTYNGVGICPGKSDTLYIISEKNVPGLGYQWESDSTFTNTFTDIPGATDTIYAVAPANCNTETFFQCKEVCLSNGHYKESGGVRVHVNQNPYCYCVCQNYNACPPIPLGFGGTIVGVSIQGTTLNNADSSCNTVNAFGWLNTYTYFAPSANTTGLLTRNTQYTISVTNDTVGPLIFIMWLDYNGNGVFDSNEYTFIHYNLGPSATATANFFVPANAKPGLTGLRVRAIAAGDYYDGTSACWGYYSGETEDYMVTIDTATEITNIEQGIMNVEVFPNPAHDAIAVRSKESGVRSVEIENVVGEKVIYLKTPNTKLPTKIDVSSLAPGIYFVKVQTEKGTVVKKFVKE